MALNKVLQGILSNFKKDFDLEDMEQSKAFEYLINYLLISKYHPEAFNDEDDIERIIVDKKSQFGLDAIAFIVNGNLVVSKEDIQFYTKNKKLDVEILFIQAKTEEKCDTGDLLKTVRATKNFINNFDAIIEKNSNILNAREIYDELFDYQNYRYCTSYSPRCTIYFVNVAQNWDQTLISSICEQEKKDMEKSIDDIKSFEINVIGRQYIIEAYNEIKNSISVTVNLKNCIVLDRIEGVQEAYIGYISGDDYLSMISDSDGSIRRRIFYENVRDYQGFENSVNNEIRDTIRTERTRSRFVLLNNGVTIITKSVTPLGAHSFELSDFQIVNGCQTSNEIFNCKELASEILVPVKIIYTTDSDLISSIVKATNRQSPVPEEAFVALSKYHKELQMCFYEYSKEMPLEMYYERRSGENFDMKGNIEEYQKVKLHGVIRAFESVYRQSPNRVYSINPANILKSNKEVYFCEFHENELYYIASYLFGVFVSMQKIGKFSKRDYILRFYVIMIVRILMVGYIEVPDFGSKDMKKEIQCIMNILKNNPEEHFIKAKDIISSVLNETEFSGREYRDVLRTVEFNKKVKERMSNVIKNKGR